MKKSQRAIRPHKGLAGLGERRQAAQRLLQRLTASGAHLRPLGGRDAPPSRLELFGLFVAKNGHARPVQRIEAEMVRALRAAGLIIAEGERSDRWRISPEGLAHLRRARGPEAPFLAQHREMGVRYISGADSTGNAHAVNLAESPLAWLATRKAQDGTPLLAPELFAAGERLREDFTRAALMAKVTLDWGRPVIDGGGGGRLNLTEAAVAARQRVRAALLAVGPELQGMLVSVCCHLQGLETAERALRLPSRSGKVVLKIALEALARHYGMIRVQTNPALRVWKA